LEPEVKAKRPFVLTNGSARISRFDFMHLSSTAWNGGEATSYDMEGVLSIVEIDEDDCK
jgi:hypothetical protein